MGNRAVVTADMVSALYLHWNGGRDSIEGFLAYCKLKGYHDFSRFVQVVTNFLGATDGSSVELGAYDDMYTWADDDNGVYVIDPHTWQITARWQFDGREQQECSQLEMLEVIDAAQGRDGRLMAEPAHMLDGSADLFLIKAAGELFTMSLDQVAIPSRVEGAYPVEYPEWIRADHRSVKDKIHSLYCDIKFGRIALAPVLAIDLSDTDQPGYICKQCGKPAPMGIGYVDNTPGAYARSLVTRSCPCGHSAKPAAQAEAMVAQP